MRFLIILLLSASAYGQLLVAESDKTSFFLYPEVDRIGNRAIFQTRAVEIGKITVSAVLGNCSKWTYVIVSSNVYTETLSISQDESNKIYQIPRRSAMEAVFELVCGRRWKNDQDNHKNP
jgi:hypothetical protein